MTDIHDRCAETADEHGVSGDYVLGANIAGFLRVARKLAAPRRGVKYSGRTATVVRPVFFPGLASRVRSLSSAGGWCRADR